MDLEDVRLLGSALTRQIISCAIAVHKELGPGLLEGAYRACLAYELRRCSLPVACEVEIPIAYRGTSVECGFRADLIVDNRVIIEVKSVDRLLPVHAAQVLTYLKLARMRVGLLLNFNVTKLPDGLRRIVL